MDEGHYLILLKNEDKTAQVASYHYENSLVLITYRRSSKEYSYPAHHALILEQPVITEITQNQAVFASGYPLYQARRVLDFGPKVRVRFANGQSEIYDKDQLRIESSGAQALDPQRIMAHWRAISRHVKSGEEQGQREEQEAFLQKEFAKLSFVHPDSVLSHYLNRSPIKTDIPVHSTPIYPFSYNLSQKAALDQALRSTISVIEGPPGTGKTQTILNILANVAVMQRKKVAVVSGNNSAVQNVREKMEKHGYHFFVAGLGKKENKEHFFANLPDWDVLDWKSDLPEEEMLAHIQKLDVRIDRLMELDREKAQLKQELSGYLLEQEHFEHYFAKQGVRELEKWSFYRQTPERILELMKDDFLAVELMKEDSLVYKFKLFFKHGFTRFKLLREQGMDVVLNAQRRFYELRVEELSDRIAALEGELRSESYASLLEQHHQCSEELFRHRLHEYYHNRPKVKCNEKSYRHIKHFPSFIEHYPIVLSTTHSLRNCIPENYLFDYCIIDESSQVDLLTGALALSCCKQAIIVGDTKQLPQIVDMKIEQIVGSAASVGIHEGYSYFRHNLLSSMLDVYGDSLPKVMLREHYRCHPRIIEFCNRKYYDGALIAFTKEEEGDSPLLIYRTAPGTHMREVTYGTKGKFNQRELDVIQQEVLAGYAETAAGHEEIGFSTPYRKQVDKASEQFAADIESDTIHKYQGREKPVMIVSTVLDGTRSGRIGITFVNDPCKINVAVSRAQRQFILVTDHALFRPYGNEIGDLMRYMEYSTLDSNVVDSEIVSVFDLLYREYSEKLRDFRKRALLVNASKFPSENLMQALLENILSEPQYSGFTLGRQVLLLNLFCDLNRLNEDERKYVRNRSSVDFAIYHKLDKSLALAIEVDGFAFHENKPEQLERDRKKNAIFKKFGHELLRFSTTGSSEERQIRERLDSIMQK